MAIRVIFLNNIQYLEDKILKKTLFLSLFFYLFLVSIGSAAQTVGFLIPVSGLGDQSFNDMTYAGLIRAKNTYNFKLVRETCTDSSPGSHREAMEKLISQEAKIIVTNGWEFTPVIKEYAGKYPDRYFIINDFPLPGYANVLSTVFGQHEGSFLAGALAAWTSKSGKIGFIGGKDMPVIRAFLVGFKEGANYARKDIDIETVFLSQKSDDSSGFDNPAMGHGQANLLYADNIDIIFSVAGLSGNGIIRAALENKKFVIGVDADQDHMAKGHVLTSVMKRLDLATFEAISRIFEKSSTSGILVFGLKENGVSLSPMTYTHHLISPEIQRKIRELKKQIITGEITVTNYLESSANK